MRALNSVQNQRMGDVETIVVDDGSSDDTTPLVERAALPNVRVIRLENNQGVSAARNAGIRAASGALIAFLDSDDEWLPGKLAAQRRIIEDDPSVTLVTCNCLLLTDTLRLVHHSRVQVAEGPSAWKQLLIENFIPTPTVLCRREDLLTVGGFEEGVSFGEDLDVWFRLAIRGSVRVVDQVLVHLHSLPTGLQRSQQKAEVTYVLPLIERFLHEQRAHLTKHELRHIIGRRNFDIGYRTYSLGHLDEARPLFLKALRARWRIVKSILFYLDSALGGPLRSLRQ